MILHNQRTKYLEHPLSRLRPLFRDAFDDAPPRVSLCVSLVRKDVHPGHTVVAPLAGDAGQTVMVTVLVTLVPVQLVTHDDGSDVNGFGVATCDRALHRVDGTIDRLEQKETNQLFQIQS